VTYLPQASTRHKGVCVCTHGTGVRETEARAFEARVRRLWVGGGWCYSAVRRKPMASPISLASPQRFMGQDSPEQEATDA